MLSASGFLTAGGTKLAAPRRLPFDADVRARLPKPKLVLVVFLDVFGRCLAPELGDFVAEESFLAAAVFD